ncbi:LETM1 domain-containing protein [Shewanella sp. Isolate11]|uniref:LETM1 domain-containing protein n=1 Tax=Shewanella sp. Isolate11 TaxID=2908530 RepID=UPI001EFD4347|nr:LETM1 domain-containing protein [Shewanella sp. Isolate11]MCG9696907.1 LETM1 domain-containing protein [Shewanella sp. Isolate11]
MKIYRKLHKAPIRVMRISRRRFSLRLKRDMLVLKDALSQEKQETKEMLVSYARYTRNQATKEELKQANDQLADLVKGLGLGVFAVLPFAPITIPVVVKLGKLVGVDILPSSFNNLSERKANLNRKAQQTKRDAENNTSN